MASLTTHFRTLMVTDGSRQPPEEIEISELVSPGQLLVSLPDPTTKRSERISPQAGENTQISEDETGIAATCHGYPRAALSTSERGQTANISVLPLLRPSADLMEAYLNLLPPIPPAGLPEVQTLLDILAQTGVTYGVDGAAIERALRTVAESGLPVLNSLIARGKAPLHGKDATLRLEVEIGPSPGKLLANGTIDFRERMLFVAVSQDQILARKVPPAMGKPGMNLRGEPIAARDGKDLQVKVSEDTCYREEDGTVRATAPGVLTMVNNDTLRVSSQQRIEGDVGYSTGNIRSQNAVEITGSILPDFMVSTKGNLLVGGNIQSATVNSHGNIVVKGGILGPSSTIKVQGDADIFYIERSLLNAGGDIVIRGSAYYSTIAAAGNVQCPEKVKLVGGTLIAGGSLHAAQLGSASAEPIHVAVGTDPRRYRRYQDLQRSYRQALQEIQTWHARHGQGKKNGRAGEMEERLRTLEQELSRFNLIPDSPEDSLGEHQYFYTEAQIVITGRITAGTSIRIGNDTTVVKRDLSKSRICMDRHSGAITFISL